MRLWHVEMLPFLPKKQLRGQWREIIALASMLENPRFQKHPLIKKLKEFPKEDFSSYVKMYTFVMQAEGFKLHKDAKLKLQGYFGEEHLPLNLKPFKEWHNDRYLLQCYHNLEEKFDLGLIPKEEFQILENFIKTRRW